MATEQEESLQSFNEKNLNLYNIDFYLFWKNIAIVQATGLATDARAAERW